MLKLLDESATCIRNGKGSVSGSTKSNLGFSIKSGRLYATGIPTVTIARSSSRFSKAQLRKTCGKFA